MPCVAPLYVTMRVRGSRADANSERIGAGVLYRSAAGSSDPESATTARTASRRPARWIAWSTPQLAPIAASLVLSISRRGAMRRRTASMSPGHLAPVSSLRLLKSGYSAFLLRPNPRESRARAWKPAAASRCPSVS